MKKDKALAVPNPMKPVLENVKSLALTKEDIVDLMVHQAQKDFKVKSAELYKERDVLYKDRNALCSQAILALPEIVACLKCFPETAARITPEGVTGANTDGSYIDLSCFEKTNKDDEVEAIDLQIAFDNKVKRRTSRFRYEIQIKSGDAYFEEFNTLYMKMHAVRKELDAIYRLSNNTQRLRLKIKHQMLTSVLGNAPDGKKFLDYINDQVTSNLGQLIKDDK
jgi:hypothetical protein